MDISMNENYTISNETTGQVKYVCAKVLMANVDNTNQSQALIQNPIVFDQPLGKLDRLSFKIYFDDDSLTPAWLYIPSYLDINEWNATFQIEEEIGYANVDAGWGETPTIPIPSNPDAMQYLYLKPGSDTTPSTNKQKRDVQFVVDSINPSRFQTSIVRPTDTTPSSGGSSGGDPSGGGGGSSGGDPSGGGGVPSSGGGGSSGGDPSGGGSGPSGGGSSGGGSSGGGSSGGGSSGGGSSGGGHSLK